MRALKTHNVDGRGDESRETGTNTGEREHLNVVRVGTDLTEASA